MAKGLDISEEAIKFARKNFGAYFFAGELKGFVKENNEKFDLIICNELIEHLSNPVGFIKDCLKILNKNGKILITTPNKDFSSKSSIWRTDEPPAHLFWFSKRSFEYLSKTCEMDLEFFNFKGYSPKEWNYLINILMEKFKNPDYTICENGEINKEVEKQTESKFTKMIKKILIDFTPVRILSNKIISFAKGFLTLCAILSKT